MKTIALTLRVDEQRERRDGIDQAWYRVLLGQGLRPVLIPNAPDLPGGVGGLLADLRVDGVVLTGGNDLAEAPARQRPAPERDAVESELIEACRERDIPLLGVCRGLQKLVVHYGGELTEVAGHAATRHAIEARAGARVPEASRESVNSFHDFGIRRDAVRAPLEVTATSPDGFVEAVAHVAARQWGIMWHPERDPFDPRDGALLKKLFEGSCG